MECSLSLGFQTCPLRALFCLYQLFCQLYRPCQLCQLYRICQLYWPCQLAMLRKRGARGLRSVGLQ